MMGVRAIIFIAAVLFFCPLNGNARNAVYNDPFRPVLPEIQKPEDAEAVEKYVGISKEREIIPLPPLKVEGVLWGAAMPQAIVEGEVYKIGDKLKSINAEIADISKSTVFIDYQGITYELKVTKGEEK